MKVKQFHIPVWRHQYRLRSLEPEMMWCIGVPSRHQWHHSEHSAHARTREKATLGPTFCTQTTPIECRGGGDGVERQLICLDCRLRCQWKTTDPSASRAQVSSGRLLSHLDQGFVTIVRRKKRAGFEEEEEEPWGGWISHRTPGVWMCFHMCESKGPNCEILCSFKVRAG